MATTLKLPDLHEGQAKVYLSRARFRVVCCGRRFGKTFLGLLECIIVASKGGRAWWIAPTYGVGAIGWNMLKMLLRGVPGLDWGEQDRKVTFPGGGLIQVKSGERTDLLRGESLDFVCFDEAADVREEAWTEAIRPALSDRRGRAMFIGTPRGMDNWFYGLFRNASEDTTGRWAAFQMPTSTNPHVPPEEIEMARTDGSMHPILFAQEYLAEFVVPGGSVFKPDWERWWRPIGPWNQGFDSEAALTLVHEGTTVETCMLSECIRFITCDLAVSTKTAADYTVLATYGMTPKDNLCLLDVVRDRMEGPDIVPAMQRARDKWHAAFLVVEAVAFQLSIVQAARRAGLPVRDVRPDKDKMSRALAAAAFQQGGRLWWRQAAFGDYVAEVRAFPRGAHDDCVDTVSYACEQSIRVPRGPQLVSW